MKVVEVKEQVRPPLKRCVELVLSGVKYRLFRAGITVVIIALAVAFLMTMLTESLITRRVVDAIEAETAPRRLLQFWVGRLSSTPDAEHLAALLADMRPGDARWREFAGWGPFDDAQLARLSDIARRQRLYTGFFEDLDAGKRRVLIGRERGNRAFAQFIDQAATTGEKVALDGAALARFEEELGRSGERFPTSIEAFREFLRDWQRTLDDRRRIIRRHADAIAALHRPGRMLEKRSPKEALAAAGDDLPARLAAEDVGLILTPEELKTVRREAALAVDAEKIQQAVGSALLKALLAKRKDAKVADVDADMLFAELDSSSGAEWFVELTNKTRGMDVRGLNATRIYTVASRWRVLRDSTDAAKHGTADANVLRDLVAEQKGVGPEQVTDGEIAEARKDEAFWRFARASIERKLAAEEDLARLRRLAEAPLVREELAQRRKMDSPDAVTAETLLEEASTLEQKKNTPEGARWLVEQLQRVRPLEPLGLTVQRVREVAAARMDRARLAQTEALVAQSATKRGFLGFSGRTMWLIVVSFMVCVVGIANAMLMSVTERFREIATMKCLGATDGFVMISFVMESCLQGVAGSAIGLVLGFTLGTVRTWASYGWIAVQHMPALEVLAAGGASVVLGILISAMAAVYPAWVAARLAPMEAMRIE